MNTDKIKQGSTKEAYINIIDQAIGLSANDKILFAEHLEEFELKKKDFFLSTGGHCDKYAFIVSGLTRMYIVNEKGKEIITCFFEDNYYMGDYASFTTGNPSDRYIQAVTEVKGVAMSLHGMVHLQKLVPRFKVYLDEAFQSYMISKSRLQREILSNEAYDAYQVFIKHHPKAGLYSPQRYIASFLGITEHSLSRAKSQNKGK